MGFLDGFMGFLDGFNFYSIFCISGLSNQRSQLYIYMIMLYIRSRPKKKPHPLTSPNIMQIEFQMMVQMFWHHTSKDHPSNHGFQNQPPKKNLI